MLRPEQWVRSAVLGLVMPLMAGIVANAQEGRTEERVRMLDAAARLMRSAKYCALVTLDAEGQPQARAMDPFPPEPDMSVWLATNRKTRKVGQIRANPRVALFYLEPSGAGYVTLVGQARLVDDPAEKARRWKPGWKEFYSQENRGEDYMLIHFSPTRVEVVSTPDGIASEPDAWKPAILELSK